MKKLTILIPTYNRCDDLIYNISLLDEIITKGKWVDRISIIISNNSSTDKTDEEVVNYSSKSEINIVYFQQSSNIGLEKNALFCLEKAETEYVMYLGDDDYLTYDYIKRSLDEIDANDNLTCIIPAWVGISPTKEVIPGIQRDLGLPTKLYKKGFDNCLENSWRGHQLSGLVFKREGLLKSYIDRGITNIYPFIYFTSLCSLNGDLLHLTEYPVKVTQPGQDKKDWGYGKDGLIGDIFDNYKKIGVSNHQRAMLELHMIQIDPGRYMNYYNIGGWPAVIKAMKNIVWGKNTSFRGGIYIFIYFIRIILRKIK